MEPWKTVTRSTGAVPSRDACSPGQSAVALGTLFVLRKYSVLFHTTSNLPSPARDSFLRLQKVADIHQPDTGEPGDAAKSRLCEGWDVAQKCLNSIESFKSWHRNSKFDSNSWLTFVCAEWTALSTFLPPNTHWEFGVRSAPTHASVLPAQPPASRGEKRGLTTGGAGRGERALQGRRICRGS